MDNFNENQNAKHDCSDAEPDFTMGDDAPSYDSTRTQTKKVKKPMNITRKGFVIILIICMLLTSAISIGGVYTLSHFGILGDNGAGHSATHYTLTTSNDTLSYESVVSKNENAVVSIKTEAVTTDSWAKNYVTEGAGSGVIIDPTGYILTCNHVIADASKVTVTTKDEKEYTASVVGTDPQNDLAVLEIDAQNLTAAVYGDSSKLSVGSPVVAIGNPLGELGGTATTGIISALNRELIIDDKSLTLLQTDASINPGNSGGGLFDGGGNLIGVVVAKSSGSDVEGLGFAIPINTAAKIAKHLIEHGSAAPNDTAAIGINVITANEEEATINNLGQEGVYITKVSSPEAKEAGFKVQDMIYSIGDDRINTSSDLASVLAKYKPGDRVTVTIIRDNKGTKDLTTTLVKAHK